MSKYAIVKDGLVTNVVQWDGSSPWNPPGGAEALPVPPNARVGPGWTLANKGAALFSPPAKNPGQPEPPPLPSVTDLVASLESAETLEDVKAALIAYHSAALEQNAFARARRAERRGSRGRK